MCINICLCGATAGFPHTPDCPRPLYRCTDAQAEAWEEERRAIRNDLAERQMLNAVAPFADEYDYEA